MPEPDKPLPRNHAYIRMRNAGYRIDIDFAEVISAQVERMIRAVTEILKDEPGRPELHNDTPFDTVLPGEFDMEGRKK